MGATFAKHLPMTHQVIARINTLWANLPLRAKALALLILPLPVAIVVSVAIYGAHRGAQNDQIQMQRAWDMQNHLYGAEQSLLNAEVAVFEFLQRGDGSRLDQYEESKRQVGEAAAHFGDLIREEPGQAQAWREVRPLIDQEFDLLESLRASPPSASPKQRRDAQLWLKVQELSMGVRARLTAMRVEQDRVLRLAAAQANRSRFRVFPVFFEGAIVGMFFQLIASLALAGAIAGQIRSLAVNARRFCQGLPTKLFKPDTREISNLANELQQAAALMADHERELRQSEMRFRSLFKEAPIAYHEIDDAGIIRHVNHAEGALLGVEREELVGKYVWETVAPGWRDRVRRTVLERLGGASQCVIFECDYQCSDGTMITVEVHENLIRDRDGRITGIRSAMLDVTARKMVDMAVRKVDQYARELRTKNDELLLALDAAREGSATKGRFLASMSHELRTPLNGIIGLTELMYDGLVGPLSDEHKEYLGDILASSRHLLQLVNDVLDLAKVESGKMEFRREAVKIPPLLDEVRDVLRILADKKRIAISIEIGHNLDTVVTDSARLKQVVYNYLSNAIKFTPDDGSIIVRAEWEGGRAFRIEVEDVGPGIQESDIPRLFADFLQLDGRKPNQGTGLGLALTKRIVEGQGGIVGVRSALGTGSVFFAVLPSEFPPDFDDDSPSRVLTDSEKNAESKQATAEAFASIPTRPRMLALQRSS
jgi:PAS domain S-box-containing protein